MAQRSDFNIFIIGQSGRLQYEALIFAASLREKSPGFKGKLIVGEPVKNHRWNKETRINNEVRQGLESLGAQIVPFENEHFGEYYPYGNKIEGLAALPEGEPFIFFDTDTLITGELTDLDIDFDRPAASMRREGTWPEEELYWPGYTAIWKSLYDHFGLDFGSSLDLSKPDEYWQRYLYFNAGWFFYKDPAEFRDRFLRYALEVRDNRPDELVIQPIDPWLDQIVLPLVIHGLGGGRPGPALDALDGDATCHYRMFPLLYARESDKVVEVLEQVTTPNKIKKLLKNYDPIKRMVYQGRGKKVRALFDQNDLPRRERQIRNKIKSEGFWMR